MTIKFFRRKVWDTLSVVMSCLLCMFMEKRCILVILILALFALRQQKGLAHDSFLFGTCHTGVHDYTIGELYGIFPRLKHIMKDVDCVMTETNHNLKDSLVIAECVKAAEIGMIAFLPNALNSMPDTITLKPTTMILP